MLCLSFAAFMSTLDTIMVSITLPTITRDLHVTAALASWIFIISMLVSSSFLMAFGSIGDKFGHRRVFLWGFVLFSASSFLSAFAGDIRHLLILRALLGAGAGIVMSLSPALVATVLPPAVRGKAFGMIAASASVALMTGPVIGGYLIGHFSWNWIFLVNVPVGLAAIILGFLFVPADIPQVRTRFDYPAAVLLFLCLAGLLFCMNADQMGADYSTMVPFILPASCLLGMVFLWHECRTPSPMIPLRLFRNVPFAVSVFAALTMMTAYGGVLMIFPFFFESVWMLTPETAGSLIVPASVGLMAASLLTGGLVDRIGSYRPALIASLVALAGSVVVLFLGPGIFLLPAVLGLFLFGAGSGGFYPPNISLVMKYAPKGDEGAVSGILMTMRMLGQAAGFAIFGAVFGYLAGAVSGGQFRGPGSVAPDALMPAFTGVFLVTAILLVITLVLVFLAREGRDGAGGTPGAS
jgi:EmrB/QacA subfamily drug resistance transporter